MTALRTMAVVLGGLVMLTRGVGVVSPDRFRRMALDFASRACLVRAVGVVIFCLGLWIWRLVPGADLGRGVEIVFRVLAVLWFVLGPLLVIGPKAFEAMVGFMLVLSSGLFIRVMCILSVLVGCALIWLGGFVMG